MRLTTMCVSMALLAGAAAAGPYDFDFEGTPVGPLAGDMLVLSSQGVNVTFSGPGLNIRDFGGSFGGAGHVLSSTLDAGPIQVDFDQAVQQVSFENLINGRYSAEVDAIDGWAYDAGNNLVDSFTADISDFPTLSGPGIVRVVWQESVPGQGFVVDNVSFVIPAPGAMALLGLGGVCAARRRR